MGHSVDLVTGHGRIKQCQPSISVFNGIHKRERDGLRNKQ